jgi:ssDNA-binding Zn-finger/Zn-ribbon topoisomerase 1
MEEKVNWAKPMGRPHFHKGIAHLRRLFASNENSFSILQELSEELAHRKTPDARSLMKDVLARLEGIDQHTEDPDIDYDDEPSRSEELFGNKTESYGPIPDDQKRPDRLSRIRPPGTPGLPDAYVRPLKQEVTLNLPVNADLPDRFIAALAELIREIKRTGSGQKRYELEKGTRVESTRSDTLYAFPFPDQVELFEEAQIEVQVAGRQIAGMVVSIEIGKLLLALKEDIGSEIHSAVLLIDSTALLEALRDRIEKVKKTEITLNRTLADAVVGEKSWPTAPTDPIPTTHQASLNRSQFGAYEHALRNAVTFIWGPPGCGKTKTLGQIVRSAFEGGKRILVCSNTNKAVDQILYQVCIALGREHPAMEEGRVVRLGRVVDDKLEAEYREFVTVDGIVERRSADLKVEKQRLESSIAQIDAHTEGARQILARFEALDQGEQRVATEQERTNQIAQEGKLLQQELASIKSKETELLAELEKRRTAFLKIFLRNESAIQTDLERNASKRKDAELRLQTLGASYAAARGQFEQARRTRDDLISRVSGLNRANAQAVVSGAKEERDRFVGCLREVEAKIAALRDSVLREARVLGATCTKAYLSQKDIGQVDMTVIDEASMVILPVVWFSAGISKERVIISGDFRQIPPIVPTQQEAVFEALGRDAFTAAGVTDPNDGRLMMLSTQYRMRPEICELIAGPMYEQRLVTFAGRQTVRGQLPPKPFEQPLTIIDTSDLWPFETQNIFFSRFNMLHALLARNLAWHMLREGVIHGKSDFGICTPYAAQSRMIQKLLEGERLDGFVPVGTVHRYQGDERRIMLLDIPESHGGSWALGQFVQGLPPEQVGARLINVAVSRAQEHLLVLANLTYLDRRLPSTSLLRGILYDMQEKGRVVPGRDVLRLRPIQSDLSGLIGQMPFDEVAESLGIFDEAQFERALSHDIQAANRSVVIFSGYITPSRVGKIGDLLRSKIHAGVKVRCVTRPPKLNGSIPESSGREAVEMLEGIGAVVDCRSKIHQKVCLIDNRIVWWGSLNALSHMYHSDETMTRAVNEGFAALVAAHMSKRPISVERASATVAEAENPRCPSCGQRTVLDEGRYGPFFYCEASCGWRQSVRQDAKRARGHKTTDDHQSGSPKKGPPCPECGGETVARQSKYGTFYGCARYPKCKGIVKSPHVPKQPSRGRRPRARNRPN